MTKNVSVFGDSISTFAGYISEENRWYYNSADTNKTGIRSAEDTWWMQVIDAEGSQLLSNASFSGSMVDGAGFPAGRSKERAAQLLGPGGEAPDEVLVFIGINDYGWGSPEAQAAGGSEAAPEAYPAYLSEVDPGGPAPADAAKRFEAAYEEMLANIRDVAPNSEIWCVTLLPSTMASAPDRQFCFNLRGIPLDDYNDAIESAASKVGAKLADVRALGFDYESVDGTHPTREGMRQFAMLVQAAMAKTRGDDEKAEAILVGYPQHLQSRKGCTDPLYMGCPGSIMQPSRWSCVI